MRQWQDVGRARAFSSIYIIDMESIFTSSQKAGEEIEKENKTHSYPLFPILLPYSSFLKVTSPQNPSLILSHRPCRISAFSYLLFQGF